MPDLHATYDCELDENSLGKAVNYFGSRYEKSGINDRRYQSEM